VINCTRNRWCSKTKKMLTQEQRLFLKKKYLVALTRFDKQNHDYVTWQDFNRMADRFVEHGNLSDEKEKHIRDSINALWRNLFDPESETHNLATKVYCDTLMEIEVATLDAGQRQMYGLIFDVVAENREDKIRQKEFGIIYTVLGIDDEALVTETFNAIDTDKDGLVSLDEILVATTEFCIGIDESSPYRLFFGPLD